MSVYNLDEYREIKKTGQIELYNTLKKGIADYALENYAVQAAKETVTVKTTITLPKEE